MGLEGRGGVEGAMGDVGGSRESLEAGDHLRSWRELIGWIDYYMPPEHLQGIFEV